MSEQRLLTARQLADRLGIAASTVYRMSAVGLIPTISIGAKLTGRRFDEAAVREALAKQQAPLRTYHPPKNKLVAVGK